MHIYTFRSPLFEGQKRTIITSFPIQSKKALEDLVNSDNTYPTEKAWRLENIQ